ncbi:MAG: carbon starvation CstA 5TM domain-containing protein, partial [Bacteroidales bacterium]|nr:carbon starvation CstA 5TM domain-containing protein [Bacteroidales bacterium]
FEIIWRYFAWCNQVLACVTLWTITVYLFKNRKFYFISLFPALFMTMVVSSYILIAREGLKLPHTLGYMIAGVITLGACIWYALYMKRYKKQNISYNK